MAFKHQDQILIDTSWLTFQEDGPNVKKNPLAYHEGPAVNAVEECGLQRLKQLKDVITSRRFILKVLREAGIIFFEKRRG